MASHGMLPSRLAGSNRFRAPSTGLLATSACATVMVLMNYTKSLVEGFTFITLVVTAATLPLYLCCSLALVVLWNAGERGASPWKLLLGVLGFGYSVFAFVGMGREPFVWGMALAATGIPVYAFLRRAYR
jgi:APA family basic amino acid/polyamine antiporter